MASTTPATPSPRPNADTPIRITAIELETPIGPARGWSAMIDLTSPHIEIVVTAPSEAASEATLTPTDTWALETDVAVAINANFFNAQDAGADIVGLSVSNGVTISPARARNGTGDPALVFTADGAARIMRCAPCEVAWNAVAGVGGSQNPDAPDALLLDGGVNHGANASNAPGARHPRTGAGVSADGRTLFLLVMDGRQPGWSVGVTLDELAELLREMGAHDGLNLDGGGSSSFLSRISERGMIRDTLVIQNRPSEGRHRPVANHLGIRWNDAPIRPNGADRR